MMKSLLIVPLLLGSVAHPAHAQGQPTKHTPICEALDWDWKHIERRMAFEFATERHQYNAITSTEMALNEANDLARAAMTLQFMRDNKCPLPKRAPNAVTYSSAADACIKARKAGTVTPGLCDENNWKPN